MNEVTRILSAVEQGDPNAAGLLLPLAHVLQRCVDYNGIYAGAPGYYAESIDKLQANLAETRPTLMAAVPEGRAVWICPRTGDLVSAVGRLRAPDGRRQSSGAGRLPR